MDGGGPLDKPKHFLPEEVEGLAPQLVAMLDKARDLSGVSFIIASGRRTEAQNAEAGGVKNSAHVRGLAVDLRCYTAAARFRMVRGLFLAGFRRIGVYDRHVHADVDDTLPLDVVWVGVSH